MKENPSIRQKTPSLLTNDLFQGYTEWICSLTNVENNVTPKPHNKDIGSCSNKWTLSWAYRSGWWGKAYICSCNHFILKCSAQTTFQSFFSPLFPSITASFSPACNIGPGPKTVAISAISSCYQLGKTLLHHGFLIEGAWSLLLYKKTSFLE